MKLLSWNVNGIRAVERKGELEKCIQTYDPDVFLIQETKAQEDQLTALKTKYSTYQQVYHSAEKRGYSGTSIWIKKSISNTCVFQTGMPNFQDTEGRILRVDIEKQTFFSVYFPNGGKSPEAWNGKLQFYDLFLSYINTLRKQGQTVFWAGDVNCAHEEIDLARPKDNKTSIGFLPEERAWITKVIQNNWVDIFREKHPQKKVYSWWHVITRARERNVGWRIDYFFGDKNSMSQVKNIEYLNNQMGSDHCPVLLEI